MGIGMGGRGCKPTNVLFAKFFEIELQPCFDISSDYISTHSAEQKSCAIISMDVYRCCRVRTPVVQLLRACVCCSTRPRFESWLHLDLVLSPMKKKKVCECNLRPDTHMVIFEMFRSHPLMGVPTQLTNCRVF